MRDMTAIYLKTYAEKEELEQKLQTIEAETRAELARVARSRDQAEADLFRLRACKHERCRVACEAGMHAVHCEVCGLEWTVPCYHQATKTISLVLHDQLVARLHNMLDLERVALSESVEAHRAATEEHARCANDLGECRRVANGLRERIGQLGQDRTWGEPSPPAQGSQER